MKYGKMELPVIITLCLFLISSAVSQETKRAMTFMDILELRNSGSPDISPDGSMFIYTISAPDWKERKWFSDIHITDIRTGKGKRMTYTEEKNERSPIWYKDASFFAFLSDRIEEMNQIFFMRPDGGEAWQVTRDKNGVESFAWSRDWSRIAYTAGKPEERQLWLVSGTGENPLKLSSHNTPVQSFTWSPDSRKIYFTAPDSVDSLETKRKDKKFDVDIKDKPEIPSHLWEIDIETKKERRLTSGADYSISSFVVSDAGQWIAFTGRSTERYASFLDADLYLLDAAAGTVSRITDNSVPEGDLGFSPDGRLFAFTMPDGGGEFMNLNKIHVMSPNDRAPRKLLNGFGHDCSISFWSEDGGYIYFSSQVGVDQHLYRVAVGTGEIEQVTRFGNAATFGRDREAGRFFAAYSDPEHPADFYYVEPGKFADKESWTRLSDANPHVKEFILGRQETIHWTSSDGKTIEGILIMPENSVEGRRYPLIVQIHGGPAGAYTNRFSAGYGTYTQIFAANDYVVFQPNYRGSTGYGQEFAKEIAGDYFRQAYDDIITGVDYLIEKKIAHPDSMGFMGWSAGGHWSNWTLVSTDRFKAISTGAGAMNWISLYAQTDMQFTREFYFKGTPYDNWDHYLEVSPLKYIKNAKTPTLIHFGEDDRRIPRPQGEELYIALKKFGVPVEFIVYPGMPHGLTEMRYQMVKMQAEFNWFEKWIRGKKDWIDWKEMLQTIER